MEKAARRASVRKNGVEPKRVSELGKQLRQISDSYIAKGGKLLSQRELSRELAERRH